MRCCISILIIIDNYECSIFIYNIESNGLKILIVHKVGFLASQAAKPSDKSHQQCRYL